MNSARPVICIVSESIFITVDHYKYQNSNNNNTSNNSNNNCYDYYKRNVNDIDCSNVLEVVTK